MSLNRIKDSYARLAVIDLNILTDLETSSFDTLSRHLKDRDGQLRLIGAELALLTEDGLSESEQDEVLALQDSAERRNRRILAVVEALHSVARDESIKRRVSGPRTNPYKRTAQSGGRVRA